MAEAENPETFCETRVLRVYDGAPPFDSSPGTTIRSPFLDDMAAPIKVAPDAPTPVKSHERKPLRPMIGKDPSTFREFQRVFKDWDFRIGTF